MLKNIGATFSIIGFSTLAAAGGEFHLNADQYYRSLQIVEAKGLISGLSKRCDIDAADKTYFCLARHEAGTIIFRSPKSDSNLTSITFGAAPKDIAIASVLATAAILSMDTKTYSGAAAKQVTQRIARTMESVYVRHGSDIDLIAHTMDVYSTNKDGDMAIVSIIVPDK